MGHRGNEWVGDDQCSAACGPHDAGEHTHELAHVRTNFGHVRRASEEVVLRGQSARLSRGIPAVSLAAHCVTSEGRPGLIWRGRDNQVSVAEHQLLTGQ